MCKKFLGAMVAFLAMTQCRSLKILLIFFTNSALFSFSNFSYGFEMEGVWKSNKKISMKWNRENNSVTEKQAKILDELFGHYYYFFSGDYMYSFFEKRVEFGKTKPAMLLVQGKYELISINADHKVSIRIYSFKGGETEAEYFVEGDNFYLENGYGREYFSKSSDREFFLSLAD